MVTLHCDLALKYTQRILTKENKQLGLSEGYYILPFGKGIYDQSFHSLDIVLEESEMKTLGELKEFEIIYYAYTVGKCEKEPRYRLVYELKGDISLSPKKIFKRSPHDGSAITKGEEQIM